MAQTAVQVGAKVFWKLEKFKSGKMTAVSRVVYKLDDGTIPVFTSYKAASAYARERFGKWSRHYPEQLKRLTKRHKIILDTATLA